MKKLVLSLLALVGAGLAIVAVVAQMRYGTAQPCEVLVAELQRDLGKIEEAIQAARRYYNAIVRDLNTACETFPSVLVANAFGFSKRDYFELDDEAERAAPAVSFSPDG